MSSQSDQSGSSVASAGDVDGDGLDDLLIGAPNNNANGTNAGATYLILNPYYRPRAQGALA